MTMATDAQLEKLQRDDHDTLIRVETTLHSLVNEMRTSNANTGSVAADHEARIRLLESDREKQFGATSGSDKVKATLLTVISILVGAISAWAILRH